MELKKRYAGDKEALLRRWPDIEKKVKNAFLKVPRELFIEKELAIHAYDDTPLPIPADQTISQPTTVIRMLNELDLKKGQKVLEIGAGSGYNAAIMSKLVGNEGKVISIEIIPELVKFAKDNIKKAKITNVKIVKADGSKGYLKEKPYDRIICTAASPKIPKAWKEQLKNGGILLTPVGDLYGQVMVKVKRINKNYEIDELGHYLFVPLRGKHGFKLKKKK